MQDGAEARLHRFQIHASGLLPLGEDAAQQRGYFPRGLGVDRVGCFFPAL
jgi:hypothetical protein